jgi:hypothetical protein
VFLFSGLPRVKKKKRTKRSVRSALTFDYIMKNDVNNPVRTDSPSAPAPVEEVDVRILFHNETTIAPFFSLVKHFSAKNHHDARKTG